MPQATSLGSFELMVMLALIRLRDDAYGVPIAREIEAGLGREVAIGSVYAALQRLEAKGLVESETGEPTAERGGRAKRYFSVSRSGLREVRVAQKAFTTLWAWLKEQKGTTA